MDKTNKYIDRWLKTNWRRKQKTSEIDEIFFYIPAVGRRQKMIMNGQENIMPPVPD
jgi:hypothetical protein